MNKRIKKKIKSKLILELPKERLPRSTRSHQVHKSVRDYDRKKNWKTDEME